MEAAFQVSHRAEAAAGEGSIAMEGEGNGGVDVTTTKLLGILASMSFFALLWETITGLDGPNAPAECASEDFLNRANDGHNLKEALQTPTWRGKHNRVSSLCPS